MNKPLFELGQVVMTRTLAGILEQDDVLNLITRHVTGDFGDLDKSDIKMNNNAIVSKEDRIFSSYNVYGNKIFVITEWDRSATTIMLASDY